MNTENTIIVEVEVADGKIREIFKQYKTGYFENNIQSHKWAAWGLTTAEYGGGFYIVGNKRTCELWMCDGFNSKVNAGSKLVSVSNNAQGYAELCHVLEQHI